MASIVQRNKSFAVVYLEKTEGKPKQKWETYRSREGAEARKWEIENALPFLGAAPKISTLSDLINEYLHLYAKRRWSFTTHNTRISILNRYVLPQIGNIKISAIDSRMLSRYFGKLYEMPPSENKYKPNATETITAGVISDIFKLLRSVFNQAVGWGICHESPMKHVAISKHIGSVRDILSTEQIIQTVNASSKQNPMLSIAIQLAFACSLRKGELLALCWADIDFNEGCIHVKKELLRVSLQSLNELGPKNVLYTFPPRSKHGKTRLVLKTPKTPAAIRKVYLPDSLLKNLIQWKKQQDEQIKSGSFTDYRFILSHEKGRPLQMEWINRHFAELLDQFAFPKVVFHSIRHTSTTHKLQISGGDIKSVQGDNGHAKPDMILNVYTRIRDEQRKEMAQQVDKTFYAATQKSGH